MATQIYNRHDPAKNYEDHRFVPGRPLQSAELNEIQSQAAYRLRGIADTILKDGNVIRDAGIVVNPVTGETLCEAGAVYLVGAVRGVKPATLTLPVVGTVAVGMRLISTIITDEEDPTLLDPATGTRAYNQKGAERTKVEPFWAWSGDGQSGDFFPIYTVTDGVLNAKAPPPQLDGITQAIARYDRDSTGGSYIVSGMDVIRLADDAQGRQVFTVNSGRAYVNGFAIEMRDSRRLVRNAQPVMRFIANEPTLSTTINAQRITVARPPLANITALSITAEKTVTLNRGTVSGTSDPLPDTSILSIQLVKQGATSYVPGTDYKLTAGAVDWSPAGAEPAPGSSYDVTYRYITSAVPTAVDDRGFTVTGAVVGTPIQVSYNAKMPRIDRLCISENGEFLWIEGASTDYSPVRPAVPSNLLALCQVVQLWTDSTRVINDGLRVTKMDDIEAINRRLDTVVQLVADQKLTGDLTQRDSATKKGMFVDPFLGDERRDLGLSQDAAIVGGELMLAIDATPKAPDAAPATAQTCAYVLKVALVQDLRTGSMKINPYMSFGLLPAQVELVPAIDRWTEYRTTWTSPVTESFLVGWGNAEEVTRTLVERSQQATSQLQYLREIPVSFTLRGFGAGEILSEVTFDGLPVTAVAP